MHLKKTFLKLNKVSESNGYEMFYEHSFLLSPHTHIYIKRETVAVNAVNKELAK